MPHSSNKSSGNRHRQKATRRRKLMKMASSDSEGQDGDSVHEFLLNNDTHTTNHKVNEKKSQQKVNVLSSKEVTPRLPDNAENMLTMSVQVVFPFFVAGGFMVLAGIVLDIVQHWEVFKQVPEVFILVPALLGLKGNLEMTLASRLSTQANLGHMDSRKEHWSLIIGNLALIQCQAVVIGFLTSVTVVVMGWIPQGNLSVHHGLLLCASSLVTACLASLLLGLVMVAVITWSRYYNINPDNVAAPIAASLGDLVTLMLLSWIATHLYQAIDSQPWLAPTIIVFCLALTPFFGWIASRNKYTKEVLSTGWTPVISSMVISSVGGLILNYTVANYKGIAVYQPVINGIGGNLVAVQASRISTSLHKDSKLGQLPAYMKKLCLNPFSIFCSSGGHARTARLLLIILIPGHLFFSFAISWLQAGHTSLTPVFMVVYLLAAFLQVFLLLYICYVLVHWMWLRQIDPDSSAIPYLTAMGDLLGTSLLALAFHFLYVIGDRDADVGD